jgi:hypothetical protein
MTFNNKTLLFFYAIAVCFFTVYTLTFIKECEAYWMHDASILITKQKLLTDTVYLFVLPLLTLFVQRLLKAKTQTILFLIHFFLALTSLFLLIRAVNKPCENVNSVHFVFISLPMALGYYLLKLICFVILFIILVQTILFKIRIKDITK